MTEHTMTAAAKLRLALSMFESGRDLMRQNLRRRHPDHTEQEIDQALFAWLRTRPGAEAGDANGPNGQKQGSV